MFSLDLDAGTIKTSLLFVSSSNTPNCCPVYLESIFLLSLFEMRVESNDADFSEQQITESYTQSRQIDKTKAL